MLGWYIYADDDVSSHGNPNFNVEDEMDLLPTYCPNRGANEFHEVLCKYVVEHGFQFKYVKNDSVRITVACKFAADTGCAWSVHTRVLPLSGVLCVKRFDGVHTCGATVRTYDNPRTGFELVSSVVADQVREQALIRPMDMVFDLKNDYGLDISYRIACLCVKKAMGEVYGDHAMSFDQLRWYSESVMEKNPNSYINLEFDQKSGRFIRYFILFRACIDEFNHCRPLLFLDRTFLKGRFKVFGDVRTLTFIFDRYIGPLQSMPNIFLSAHYGYCLFHIQMNLRDRMKYVNASHKIGLLRKLHEYAYALTVSCFNEKLEVLKKCSPVVIDDFMKDLQPKHWAHSYFRGQQYGEMCSNAAESSDN
ncbi:hypothetical protein ACSBR2_032203 [Camellia fascicularis]